MYLIQVMDLRRDGAITSPYPKGTICFGQIIRAIRSEVGSRGWVLAVAAALTLEARLNTRTALTMLSHFFIGIPLFSLLDNFDMFTL